MLSLTNETDPRPISALAPVIEAASRRLAWPVALEVTSEDGARVLSLLPDDSGRAAIAAAQMGAFVTVGALAGRFRVTGAVALTHAPRYGRSRVPVLTRRGERPQYWDGAAWRPR